MFPRTHLKRRGSFLCAKGWSDDLHSSHGDPIGDKRKPAARVGLVRLTCASRIFRYTSTRSACPRYHEPGLSEFGLGQMSGSGSGSQIRIRIRIPDRSKLTTPCAQEEERLGPKGKVSPKVKDRQGPHAREEEIGHQKGQHCRKVPMRVGGGEWNSTCMRIPVDIVRDHTHGAPLVHGKATAAKHCSP